MNNPDVIKASFYQAALGDQNWANATDGLREWLRSDLIALSTTDRATGRSVMIQGDCSPYYTDLFQSLADNPFILAFKTLGQGEVVSDSDLLGAEALARTSFYEAWLRPQRVHGGAVTNIFQNGSVGTFLMFSRGADAGKFGEAQVAALAELQPTLRHAMELHARLARVQLEQTGRVFDGQAIGWIAVEASGKIVWSNEMAETLLADPHSALTARHNRLRSSDPRQTQRLLKALQLALASSTQSGQGSNLIFRNMDTGDAVAVSVVPADNLLVKGLPQLHGAYLALQDLSRRPPPEMAARIGSMFGLTQREAELAMALVSGQTVAESAAARGLSMPTVRTQLAQLLRKTGTSRQSQLVAMLLSTMPVPFLNDAFIAKPLPEPAYASSESRAR